MKKSRSFICRLVIAVAVGLLAMAGGTPLAGANSLDVMAKCLTVANSTGICPPGSPTISGVWGVHGGVYATTPGGTVYENGQAFPLPSGLTPTAPIIGITGVCCGSAIGQYWLAGSDGGVFAFDGAPFYGSMGGKPLSAPVVGIASSPNGKGYWLVAADGGVFSFGDASYYGSMGGQPLNAPIVGIASTADGNGYWLVAADGGVFSFGDATFYGSMGGHRLDAPIVGIASTSYAAAPPLYLAATGYLLVGSDGGVFDFGNAEFGGSAVSAAGGPMIGVAATDVGTDPWGPPFFAPSIATSEGILLGPYDLPQP